MEILKERLSEEYGFDNLIGRSEAMQDVFDQIERVAPTDATVLIRGESGTGKEVVAEAIHRNSARREGPFVPVNIAAVPENLIESELFGHVAGAFTGADGNRTGRFEAAHRGTLFIDEIGDLALPSQAKLLRVLESRRVVPVGSDQEKHVDVRVVSATHRDLEQLVADGQFREDLYYRLNVVTIILPALRHRGEDVRLLVSHILEEICGAHGRSTPRVDVKLLDFFEDHRWPGNVRQLRNCLESMVVMSESDTLTLDDLPAMVRKDSLFGTTQLRIPHDLTLDDIEKAAVLARLDHCDGNRREAADSLGISLRTLQRRLKRWQNGDAEPHEEDSNSRLHEGPTAARAGRAEAGPTNANA